jgi:hypothetical protein
MTTAFLAMALFGVAAVAQALIQVDKGGPILIDPAEFDMGKILFQAKRPILGENIERAVRNLTIDMSSLKEASNFLKEHPGLRIEIIGFSDEAECAEPECKKLSERRALLVYKWLQLAGIPSSQLQGYEGLGKTQPIDFSETEVQRQNNRRVIFKVIK